MGIPRVAVDGARGKGGVGASGKGYIRGRGPVEGKPGRRSAKDPSPEAIEVAQRLYDAIRTHTPDFMARVPPFKLGQKLTGWALKIDVGLRNDGMTAEGCALVIDFAHCSADTFWRTNLLSGTKLRQHYHKLLTKAKAAKPARKKIAYNAIADRLSLDEVFP